MSKRKNYNRDDDDDDDDDDYNPEEDDSNLVDEDHHIHITDKSSRKLNNKSLLSTGTIIVTTTGKSDDISGIRTFQDYTNILTLKQDHVKRPILITKEKILITTIIIINPIKSYNEYK